MLIGKRILVTVMALSTMAFTSPKNHINNIKDKISLPKYKLNWQGLDYNHWHRPGSQDRPTKPTSPEDSKKPEKPNKPERPNWSEDDKQPEKPNKPERPNWSEDDKQPEKPDTSQANQLEEEAIRLINIERSKAGLGSFSTSSKLIEVARIKSEDMDINNYFSHDSPKYGSPFDMLRSFNINYNTAGENIAKGYSSAQSVVQGWMNSPGHRDNILNPNFNTIGIGIHTSTNGTIIWTQLFTN